MTAGSFLSPSVIRRHLPRFLAMATTYVVERGVILGALLVPLALGATELDVGTIEILLTAGSLGTALGPLGLQAAVIHERFISTPRNFRFATGVSLAGGAVFGAVVAAIAGVPTVLGGVTGAAFSTTTVLQFRIRATPDNRRVLLSGILMAVVFVGGMVVIWALDLSWVEGVPAVLFMIVVVLIVPARNAANYDESGTSRNQWGEMLRFGLPLTVGAIAGWLVVASDRLFLAEFDDLITVGHYGTIARMVGVMGGLLTTIVLWWRVESLRKGAEWSGLRLSKVSWAMTTMALLVGLVSWLPLANLAARLTDLDLPLVRTVVGLTILGVALNAVLSVLVAYLTALSNVRLIAVVFWIGAVVNVAGNLILIPRFSMTGAAVATVAGWAVALACTVGWLTLSSNSPVKHRNHL